MNPYLKYSGMAFQLVFFIFAGYYIGKYAGKVMGWNQSTASVVGLLFFMCTGLIKIIYDILKENA
jgi:hypothetical protein